MTSTTTAKLAEAFTSNRAEQMPLDVTREFILPPFLPRINLDRDRKSLRIQGGRGCGKTIFIRHLCHPTQLSPQKTDIDSVVLGRIGLYWRSDTAFCGLMKPGWLGDRDADSAFSHYATLVILTEVASFLDALARAPLKDGPIQLHQTNLSVVTAEYFDGRIERFGQIRDFAKVERIRLERWLQNPKLDRPQFLRYEDLLQDIAEDLASHDPRLSDLFFRVFVDEFENLEVNQRRLVCDAVKHAKARYSVNFAMRRHAVNDFETSANEQVVEVHDVRTIDIELLLEQVPEDFKLLASELLLLRLHEKGIRMPTTYFNYSKLSDPAFLEERLSETYRRHVVEFAETVFPGWDGPSIAEKVLQDSALRNRLSQLIRGALKKHPSSGALTEDDFLDHSKPAASVVTGCILHRKRHRPDEVIQWFREYDKGNDANPFKGWIENNLYGALFYLYIGLPQRPNLLYSGFDRLCTLARPNLRVFVELCRAALTQSLDGSAKGDLLSHGLPVISPEAQAEAARSVSESILLEQVPNLGTQGEKLAEIARRLGRLFETAHRRPSQSEPEINHFSIEDAGKVQLNAETLELLREAKVWSVLYEEKDTKNKSDYSIAHTDLVPNPMFSPYFGISYRKKRKLTLDASQVNTIFTGTGSQFESLLRDFNRKWDVGQEDPEHGQLFQ